MQSNLLYTSPNVAKKIKEYAKTQNISLKEILENCSLGGNTFSHMLHGRVIAFDSLAKIADYLDCSIDYLLGRTNEVAVNRGETSESVVSDEDMNAYLKLDEVDKAEIKGTIKQMLKAEKYSEIDAKGSNKVEKTDKIYSNSQRYILKQILREFFDAEYNLSEAGISGLLKKKVEAVRLAPKALQIWLWSNEDDSFSGDEINSVISVTGYSLGQILARTNIRFTIPYNEMGIKANITYNAASVFYEIGKVSDSMTGKLIITLDKLSDTFSGEIAAYGGAITGGTVDKEPETTI